MKKFTKIFALILTLSLSIAMLSGCVIVPINPSGSATVGGISNYNNNVTVNVVESNTVKYNSTVEMIEALSPTVYEVYAKESVSSTGVACGSGTIIADNIVDEPTEEKQSVTYFMLTCHHVIDSLELFMVKDMYGNEFNAKLIGGDPQTDIAVLCFTPEEDGFTPVEGQSNTFTKDGKTLTVKKATVRIEKNADGSDSNPIKIGESVYAIGNALGVLGGSVSHGIISSKNRDVTFEGKKLTGLIQTDCLVNGGNSGGGLFDEQGNLIGVINGGYTGDVQGINFAIPSDTAFDVFNQIVSTYNGVNYGYVKGRASFKLSLANLTSGSDLALYQYNETFFGDPTVYVVAVAPIFKGKFLVNDIIKSVQVRSEKEYKVSTVTALINYINGFKYEIGDKILFKVERNKQEVQVEIELEQFIYNNTGKFKEVV